MDNSNKPVDVIMWAGEDHYTVRSFIQEARVMGVSKRIALNSIPEGIVPGVSRIFIKHRKAILHGKLEELGERLNFDPTEQMLPLVIALDELQEQKFDDWQNIVQTYELTWSPGIIGYSYITGIQYVTRDNEEGLPEEIAHLEGYVEPIIVEYEEEWHCPFCEAWIGTPLNFTGYCENCGHEFREAWDEDY